MKKEIVFLSQNIIFLSILFFLKTNKILIIVYLLVFNFVIELLKILFRKYKQNLERKKLEIALLDEILVLSSQPRINDLKQMLYKLSKSNHKIISREFSLVLKKTEEGHSIKEVFDVLSKKYNSEILDRFLELLYNSITTGTVSVTDYRSFANNFLKAKQLIDERNSSLLIQKYTIIFAGGFIVPGIIGTVISLVNKLTTSVELSTIYSIQPVTSSTLFSVCYYCSIIYIIEYVIISSIYLSFLESDIRKAIIYVIFLMPVAIVMFFAGSFII